MGIFMCTEPPVKGFVRKENWNGFTQLFLAQWPTSLAFPVTITTRTPKVAQHPWPVLKVESSLSLLLGENLPVLHWFWDLILKGFGFSLANSFWFCVTLHWSFYSVCYHISGWVKKHCTFSCDQHSGTNVRVVTGVYLATNAFGRAAL